MSPRQRRSRRSAAAPSSAAAVSRTDLPALSAFVSGYLHQDLFEEYTGPDAALQAFLDAATGDERDLLAADWQAFGSRTALLSWTAVRRALAHLGSAWTPPTRTALDRLFAPLTRTD